MLFVADLDRGIHVILGNTLIRYAFLNAKSMSQLIRQKFDYRIPSAVVLFGNHSDFTEFIASKAEVVRDYTEWVFMLDVFEPKPETLNISFPFIMGTYEPNVCCKLKINEASCNAESCRGDATSEFARKLGYIFLEALSDLSPQPSPAKISCSVNSGSGTAGLRQQIADALNKV